LNFKELSCKHNNSVTEKEEGLKGIVPLVKVEDEERVAENE